MTQSTSDSQASLAYSAIARVSGSNTFIQGLTGIFGFPVTLIGDVAAITHHYRPLWNEIRVIYGYDEFYGNDAKTVIKNVLPELFVDIAVDKILGQVPIAGIYFNAICAKALTWRLGALFSMLSSRGSAIPDESTADAMRLIRLVFPQRDMFKFVTPDKAKFIQLVTAIDGESEAEFDRKIQAALVVLGEPSHQKR